MRSLEEKFIAVCDEYLSSRNGYDIRGERGLGFIHARLLSRDTGSSLAMDKSDRTLQILYGSTLIKKSRYISGGDLSRPETVLIFSNLGNAEKVWSTSHDGINQSPHTPPQ
jgi:hypothetical protein